MKILALAAVLFLCSAAQAADTLKVAGEVSALDPIAKKIDVTLTDSTSTVFLATPNTELELKYKSKSRFNTSGSFEDLSVGDWVEIEYFPALHSPFVADQINLFRD